MTRNGAGSEPGRDDVPGVNLSELVAQALWQHPEGFLAMDRQWRVLYVNAETQRVVGDRGELVGHNLWELFPEIVGTVLEKTYRRVMTEQRSEQLEVHFEPLKSWFDVLAVPSPNVLYVYFRNVNERRERNQLAYRNALILAAAGDGIYGLDVEGRTTFVNPAAEAMLGYAPGELLGLPQHETIHLRHADGSPYLPQDCPIHDTLRNGSVHRSEGEYFWRKDGSSFPVEFISVPIEEDGEVIGAVITFSDISERLQAAEYQREALRLAEAEEAQHKAVLQLQQAMQPATPQVDDPQLGVHYRSAGAAAAGGDLYDWQLLSDGRLYLAVVDVVGKGVVATRDALAVTHALRLLVLAGTGLGEVVAHADQLLSTTYPDLAATVLLASYDPPTGQLHLASGGHPPPLLLEGSEARYLHVTGNTIGWPGAGSDAVMETTLAPSATLVLYTDGLVEAHRDILVGFDRLRGLATELVTLAPAELARTLVERTLDAATHVDDTLALVLRRPAD